MKKNFETLLMKIIIIGALGITSQPAMAGMFSSDDFSNEQMATVKVSITDAITKAKAMQTGTVVKAELEKEDDNFVYKIDFLENGKEMKMVVDAVTGNVFMGED